MRATVENKIKDPNRIETAVQIIKLTGKHRQPGRLNRHEIDQTGDEGENYKFKTLWKNPD